MSKWTKWMPNIGDTGQHWNSEEIIKIRLDSGAVAKGMIESLVGIHFTHYKRLKANVEAEMDRDLHESARHAADAVTEQPEIIITGPGDYKTANGDQATIMGLLPDNSRWWGRFKGVDLGCLWCLDGACDHPDHPELNITGPWVEPEPECDGCEDCTTVQLLDKIEGLQNDLRSAVDVAFMHGAADWVRMNYSDDYDRLSARERSGADHRLAMLGRDETGCKSIINGPGEYVARDGTQVSIKRDDGAGHKYRFYGVKNGRRSFWSQEGFDYQGGGAVTGPWVEPEPKPEKWVAVYRDGNRLWAGGQKACSAEAIDQCNSQAANYCGPILLSHTVEEEG